MTTLITDKAMEKLAVGKVVHRQTFPRITDKDLRKYCQALCNYNPLWLDKDYAAGANAFGRRTVPSAYCTVFNPIENGGLMPASAFWAEVMGLEDHGHFWGGHAAYNRFDFERPIYVGDTIRIEVANRDAYEKEGKRAHLVVAETDYKMFDQNDEYVGVGTYGNMMQIPFEELDEIMKRKGA